MEPRVRAEAAREGDDVVQAALEVADWGVAGAPAFLRVLEDPRRALGVAGARLAARVRCCDARLGARVRPYLHGRRRLLR